MTDSTDVGERVAVRLVFNDMLFARRYIQGAIDHAEEKQTHIPIFCMLRYLSLYIHESHKALEELAPQLAQEMVVDNAQVIERSRHTVKLFDDTHIQLGGPTGVTSQFSNLAEQHRDYFLDNTWFPPARVLETDLAVYHYQGRLISTTHAICFHLGLPPEYIKDVTAMGQALMSLSQGQASYISSIADTLPWQGPSFMDALDLQAIENKDVRARKFYARAFDTDLGDKATAALIAFQCSMNFLAMIVAQEPNTASAEATFKLKFVVLYHVLSSLTKFKASFDSSLTSASASSLDAILDHPTSVGLTEPSKRGFRNTLMHYVPRGSIVAHLVPSQPLCGLVEAYYPEYDYGSMSKVVNEHTQLVADLLDHWFAQR